MIPKPRFLQKRISEVAIGTFKEVATVQESASVYEALAIFVERRVSALPVVNEQGSLTSHWHFNSPGKRIKMCCFMYHSNDNISITRFTGV